MEIYVPDTSVIIEGILGNLISDKKIEGKIIIPNCTMAELEHQANIGKETGLIGLEEIRNIRELCKKNKIEVEFFGERPSEFQIKHAGIGEIDAMIREIAVRLGAVLITNDLVQSESARAYGIKVIYKEEKERKSQLLEKFFSDKTMSVHLKEGSIPMAKKGMPGNWDFCRIREEEIKKDEIESISKEIIERAKTNTEGFVESRRRGSTIVQLGKYRIVITRPPLSDAIEITAVRPVVKLTLDDYKLEQKVIERLEKKAEGILLAGSPGEGKSTFAQAVIEFYYRKNKIIKTIESPRDLIVPKGVTQYSKNNCTSDEIQDILLLSRPDYTIFDEMRNVSDFRLYADLRLSGIGMIGVIHGATPIDAVQRFVGKLELGMIPSVIDTIIFIKSGKINKIYDIKHRVKVPSGLVEKDLARPVIEISDFMSGELEYEMYVFGEETVVVPIKKGGLENSAKEVDYKVEMDKKDVLFVIEHENKNKNADVRVGRSNYPKKVDKDGIIRFEKKGSQGKDILRSLKKGVRIKVIVN